jgi:hypothetical protein
METFFNAYFMYVMHPQRLVVGEQAGEPRTKRFLRTLLYTHLISNLFLCSTVWEVTLSSFFSLPTLTVKLCSFTGVN